MKLENDRKEAQRNSTNMFQLKKEIFRSWRQKNTKYPQDISSGEGILSQHILSTLNIMKAGGILPVVRQSFLLLQRSILIKEGDLWPTQSLRECVAAKRPDRHLTTLFFFVGPQEENQFYDFLDQNVIFSKRRKQQEVWRDTLLSFSSRMTWYQSLRSLLSAVNRISFSYFYQKQRRRRLNRIFPSFLSYNNNNVLRFTASHYSTLFPLINFCWWSKKPPCNLWYCDTFESRDDRWDAQPAERTKTLTHRPHH